MNVHIFCELIWFGHLSYVLHIPLTYVNVFCMGISLLVRIKLIFESLLGENDVREVFEEPSSIG